MRSLFHRASLLAFFGGLALGSAEMAGAQTGTLTGRVVDEQTLQPIASAQVFIPALNVGVLTGASGEFVLTDLAAGAHSVTVQRIGYQTARADVTVVAGQGAEVQFALREDALALDAIVVTGTPGGSLRRSIGNVVSQVDAEVITEMQPVATMQQLLTGRTAGLDFDRQSGNVGQGSSIRIRGVSSLTLGSQPLVYVDGVRVDNSPNAGPVVRNGAAGSALDDFNPNDIASIEVIKGPAAATLYGTEASAGVIQIITKRGQSGAPQFNLTVNQGANFMMDPAGVIGDHHGCRVAAQPCPADQIFAFNIYEHERDVHGNEIFQTGHTQSYSLSVRGGTDVVRYFVSGSWDDSQGVVDYNWDENLSARANIGVVLAEGLNFDVTAGYTAGRTSYLQQIQEGTIWENLQWAQGRNLDTPLRGFLRYRPEDIATVSATRDASRFTGTVSMTHTPTSWFTQRVIAGLDRTADENQTLIPRHPDGAAGPFQNLSLGRVALDRPLKKYSSIDYSASARYPLRAGLDLTTSIGLQYYSNELNTVTGEGSNFASPAIRSIEGATTKNINQSFVENKSLGLYLQQEVAINDRIYLTGAVRADDNSAFGAEFDAAIYPKISAAWVISDEPFWREQRYVNSLRLRSAWGKSGRQPSTFAAVTLFAPAVGPAGSPAVNPSTLGNANIGPEVGEEIEVGLDAAFLNDRVTTELTYFYQKTTNALATVPLAPSRGFPGTQPDNLGRLDNWGWEANVDLRLVERGNLAFDLGLVGAHVKNEIVDLAGLSQTNTLREGHPFPVLASTLLLSAELDEFGQAFNQMCDSGTGFDGRSPGGAPVPCSEVRDKELILGTLYPQYTWTISPSVTLGNLQLFAMVNGEFATWNESGTIRNRIQSYPSNLKTFQADDPVYVAGVMNNDPRDRTLAHYYDAAFWKLREVGLQFTIPERLVTRMGADNASFSVVGRNLWTIWQRTTHISGVKIDDPETRYPEGGISNTSTGQFPAIQNVTASLRLSF